MPIYLPPISRRQFLGGALAAGAMWPFWSFKAEAGGKNADGAERYLFMSDMHIGSHYHEERNGVKPAPNFKHAVSEILKLKNRPKNVIVAGDSALAHGGHGEYKKFKELIQPLRDTGMHFRFVLGNHDHRDNFLSAFHSAEGEADSHWKKLRKYVAIWKRQHANWFFLDSLDKTNTSPGRLGEAQVQWLRNALKTHNNKPAIVLAHHDPSLTGSAHALQDTAALYDVFAKNRHVKAFIFGHSHRWHLDKYKHVHLVNLPTVSAWVSHGQPLAFVAATVGGDGLKLRLHALNHNHPEHLKEYDLAWA